MSDFNLRRSSLILFVLVLTAAFTQGCGTGKHIENMDQNTNRLATELESEHQNVSRMADKAEAYDAYLKTMSEQITLLTEQLVAIRKIGDSVVDLFLAKVKEQPPEGPLPNIDDILKGAHDDDKAPPSPPTIPAPTHDPRKDSAS